MSKRTFCLALVTALAFLLVLPFVDRMSVIGHVAVSLMIMPFGTLSMASFYADLRYRPQENCVGVVYRDQRFRRFVDPDETVLLFPFLDEVRQEVSLGFHGVRIALRNELTWDRVPVNSDIFVGYRVDVRNVQPSARCDVLRFKDRDWEGFVKQTAQDIAVNRILANENYEYLLTTDGREELKREIALQLSEQLAGLGVAVDPRLGVRIERFRPNALVEQALQELSAASLNGKAAADRIRPLADEQSERQPAAGGQSVQLSVASAIVGGAKIPDVIDLQRAVVPVAYARPGNGDYYHYSEGNGAKGRRQG